jgi:cytochrome c biogenesis protein CcdA/glutaredoxin
MKSKNKKLSIFILLIILIISSLNFVIAENNEEKVNVYFFWGDGCAHCAAQKPFMEELENKYPEINVLSYETWKNPENVKIFSEVAQAYDISAEGVPTTFIGDKYWVGFSESMKTEMESKIINCIDTRCINPYEKQNNYEEEGEKKNNSELCVHVFLDYSCEECDQTKEYINSLEIEDVEIMYHNVNDPEQKEIYEEFKKVYGLKTAVYPTVFIGDMYIFGFNSIEKNLKTTIEKCKEKDCPCPSTEIKGITPSLPSGDFKSEDIEVLDIPLVGQINIGTMPLVLMTVLIAFIDGFNPCSLWVLTFLLGIVIYTGSRKKIFIIGLTFLLVTATAYGLFMLGLLNVFTYIGYLSWIQIVVGLIALTFAIVNIKDYFWYKKGISFTISDKYKPSLFKKVRNIMNPAQSLPSMVIATIVMALGIVLVELPCTAGFPMIWSNIIAQNNIVGGEFVALLLLYIFIYLIIELIIFFIAMITLNAGNFEEKHGRILKLVGGMIMFALGITMIFFPESMDTLSATIYLFGIAGLASFIIIFVHRKILPKFGIIIGTEKIEEDVNEKNNNKDDKDNNKNKTGTKKKHKRRRIK